MHIPRDPHLYEIARTGQSTETGEAGGCRGLGGGKSREWLLKGTGFPLRVMNVLESDTGMA